MAHLNATNLNEALAAEGGANVNISPLAKAIILAAVSRLAWAFIHEHGDDPTPIKILFFRVKIRQLAFLVEMLFGPDPGPA